MIVEGIEVKEIPGFPDYAVSKDGEVWSKPKKRGYGAGYIGPGNWKHIWKKEVA